MGTAFKRANQTQKQAEAYELPSDARVTETGITAAGCIIGLNCELVNIHRVVGNEIRYGN